MLSLCNGISICCFDNQDSLASALTSFVFDVVLLEDEEEEEEETEAFAPLYFENT
jgi:hypothetical protein